MGEPGIQRHVVSNTDGWKPSAETEKAIRDRYLAEADYFRSQAREHSAIADLTEGEAKRRASELEFMYAGNLHNHVYNFVGPVTPESVLEAEEMIQRWARIDPKCEIEIVFNTSGGRMDAGMDFYDFIQEIKRAGHRVTTAARGVCGSMGSILLQAGDHRVMGRECVVLLHEPSAEMGGKPGDIEDTQKLMAKVIDRVVGIYTTRAAETGAPEPLTKAKLVRAWKRADWWLSSDECLRMGLVDELR